MKSEFRFWLFVGVIIRRANEKGKAEEQRKKAQAEQEERLERERLEREAREAEVSLLFAFFSFLCLYFCVCF
jgi:hypothetical protein